MVAHRVLYVTSEGFKVGHGGIQYCLDMLVASGLDADVLVYYTPQMIRYYPRKVVSSNRTIYYYHYYDSISHVYELYDEIRIFSYPNGMLYPYIELLPYLNRVTFNLEHSDNTSVISHQKQLELPHQNRITLASRYTQQVLNSTISPYYVGFTHLSKPCITNAYRFTKWLPFPEKVALKVGFAARLEDRKNPHYLANLPSVALTQVRIVDYIREVKNLSVKNLEVVEFSFELLDDFYSRTDWSIFHGCYINEPFGYSIFQSLDYGKIPIISHDYLPELYYPYRAGSREEFESVVAAMLSADVDTSSVEVFRYELYKRYGDTEGWLRKLQGSTSKVTPPVIKDQSHRLSYVTVTSGRTKYFKETYTSNLENLGSSEWVILTCGLLDTELVDFIKSNYDTRVSLYHTPGRDYHLSISRNTAVRLATRDYVSMLDSDNFITREFQEFMSINLSIAREKFCVWENPSEYYSETAGRITFPKEAFYKTGGYNELFTGYGHEDVEFGHQLYLAEYPIITCPSSYYNSVPHDDSLRSVHAEFIEEWRSSKLTYTQVLATSKNFSPEQVPGYSNRRLKVRHTTKSEVKCVKLV